ncbi:MAG: cytochrome P460 family protein [Deltaproteobacteria bacterium]
MIKFISHYGSWRSFTYMVMILFIVMMGFSIPQAESKEHAKFDKEGNLIQPENFVWRKWMYVGTPLTPNSLNPPEAPFPEFHNVYIDPASYESYTKTGKFPDGTLLIKELVSVGATKAASGNGFFQGDFIGLEAAYKDSKRYPDEPGNWAYFTFSHEAPPYPSSAKLQPTAACNACHEANAAEDWVFTQFYPVLRAAKPK